jgi:hypothetical protein
MVVGVGIELVELDLALTTRLMDLESNESSQDPPSRVWWVGLRKTRYLLR